MRMTINKCTVYPVIIKKANTNITMYIAQKLHRSFRVSL